MVHTQMFGHLLAILKVKLAHQSLLDVRDTHALFTFRQDHLALAILDRLKDIFHHIEFIMSHRTIFTRQFARNITLRGNYFKVCHNT